MDNQIQNLIHSKLQKLEKQIPNFHRLSLLQLEQQTNIPESEWSAYLQREDVRQRIHTKTTEDIEIAHRIALQALTREAQKGNIQAIKELNQLSGILNQNNNKQFITHHIPRPKQQQQQQQQEDNT